MAILLTGGAGYIGSHMALALLEAGEEVVVLDNLSTGIWWAVPRETTFVEGDVGDEALLNRIMYGQRFEAIIHFAGSIVVPHSILDPLGYYLNNTVKSRTLIAAAVRHHVSHFVFSSTAAVYGVPQSVPISEEAIPQPISPYGSSKLMTEWMLRDSARAHQMHYAVLRYFNVAGADPKGRAGQSSPVATHLIKTACQTVLGLRPRLEIYGRDYDTPDGTCVRDYIHVSDLVSAHIDALRYLRGGGESGIFNCGYGKGYSVLEVIGAVERAGGKSLPVEDAPRRPGDPAVVVAGVEKARSILGWKPQLDDLDQIVASALRWEERLSRQNTHR